MKLPELYINELGAIQILIVEQLRQLEKAERETKKLLEKKLFWRFFLFPTVDPKISKIIIVTAYSVAMMPAHQRKKFFTELLAKLDESIGDGEDGARVTFKEMKEKANKQSDQL
jgi:hypothetical protein